MKRFSLLCLLSASLTLAACNFDTMIKQEQGDNTSSGSTISDSSTNTNETTSSDNPPNTDGTMSSDSTTDKNDGISTDITGVELVPVAGDNKMVFQFVNSTRGAYSDDEIYIYALCQLASITPVSANPEGLSENAWCYIDKNGKLHAVGETLSSIWEIRLSEIKNSGIQMPYMKSGRIYYSYGKPLDMRGETNGYRSPSLANPSDPNAKTYFDWLEFTVSDNGTWVNTTQVDQLGFPVLMHLIGKDAGGKPVMATTGLTKKREEIWKLYKEFVPDEFKILAGEYRIVAPAKGGFDDRNHEPYGHYFDDYVTQVWNHWKDNPTVMHHPKGEFKLRGDGTNLYFDCQESYDDNQMAKVGATYLISGKPTTSEVLEGYGKLASSHTQGADGNHVAMELALEAWVCAALNRHVAHLDPDTNWCDMYKAGEFWRIKAENEPHERQKGYYKDSPCNWYAAFWHTISENNGLAYGFCYDDVNDQSATTYVNKPTNCIVKLGF